MRKENFHVCAAKNSILSDISENKPVFNYEKYKKMCKFCTKENLEKSFKRIFKFFHGKKAPIKLSDVNLILSDNHTKDKSIINALNLILAEIYKKTAQIFFSEIEKFDEFLFSKKFAGFLIYDDEIKEIQISPQIKNLLNKNFENILSLMGSFNSKIVGLSCFLMRFYSFKPEKELTNIFTIDRSAKNGGIFFGLDSNSVEIRLISLTSMFELTKSKIIAKITLKYFIDCIYDQNLDVQNLSAKLLFKIAEKYKIRVDISLLQNLLRFDCQIRNQFFVENIQSAVSNFDFSNFESLIEILENSEELKIKNFKQIVKRNSKFFCKNFAFLVKIREKKIKLTTQNSKEIEETKLNLKQIKEQYSKILTSTTHENFEISVLLILFIEFIAQKEKLTLKICEINEILELKVEEAKILLKTGKAFTDLLLYQNIGSFSALKLKKDVVNQLSNKNPFPLNAEEYSSMPFYFIFYKTIQKNLLTGDFDNLRNFYNFDYLKIETPNQLLDYLTFFDYKIFYSLKFDFNIVSCQKLERDSVVVLELKADCGEDSGDFYYKIDFDNTDKKYFAPVKENSSINVPITNRQNCLNVTLIKKIKNKQFFIYVRKSITF